MADPKADVPDGPEVPVGTDGPSGAGSSPDRDTSAGPGAAHDVDASADAEREAPDGTGPEVDLFRPRTPVDDRWFDDEAGPVVRLFSMTRGRTRPVEEGLFDLISLVTAAEPGAAAGAVPAHVLDPEHQTLLALCRREPLSVAELGSYTDLPVSVVRVLLGDLYDAELISVTRPVPLAELPDERLLRDVINGLRAL
ncbi:MULTISPECIES: DUF742 domain-containing protein [Streptomyces]|uniref:DUF742 domain-containing protein n=1 Tax=Streptomyces TaxID=1883 RepID=UPI000998A7AA|nr:DUF742 domain-containing protein [Streptomyces pyridomyceticus]